MFVPNSWRRRFSFMDFRTLGSGFYEIRNVAEGRFCSNLLILLCNGNGPLIA